MTALPWAQQAPPGSRAGAVLVGRWQPAAPADLTRARQELRATLQDGLRPRAAEESAVQRLLLAFEELASNALRHGRPPVQVAITQTGSHWVLEVSDAAADHPPTPAVDRDPALGGLGLHLVARLSAEHGWAAGGDRKVVWACISHTDGASTDAPPAPAPATGRAGRAHPRTA